MSRNNSQIDQIFLRSETPDPEQLLAYANGDLPPAEARKVEKALADDPFLADALEGIEMTGTEAFGEMMADIDQALDSKLSSNDDSGEEGGVEIRFKPAPEPQRAVTNKKSSFRLISIAASIAVLAVVSVFLFKGPGFDPLDYYNNPANVTVRGHLIEPGSGTQGLSDDESTYNRASLLYGEAQYDEASKIFESLPQSSAKLMAGHCHFKMENYTLAAEYFQEVINLDGVLKHDGEYNLALTFLADEKVDEGRELLKKIADNNRNIYNVQADEILKKLD